MRGSSDRGERLSARFGLGVLTGRFAVLFWFLLTVIAMPVVVPDGPVVRRLMSIALFVLMLSGLRAVGDSRRQLLVGLCLAVPAVALSGVSLALEHVGMHVASQYVYLAFFFYLAYHILRWTMQRHEVDTETIYAAVSVYLLMALMWGLIYYSVALQSPGSFHLPPEDDFGRIQVSRAQAPGDGATPLPATGWLTAGNGGQGAMMYYSFVTLTTLGYGDFYPVSDAARIMAMLEATLGQLYLVILVARLVGLYTAQESERRRKASPT